MEEEIEESKSGPDVKAYIVYFCSEFIGTAIMMYIGCLGCVLEAYKPLQPLVVASSFAFGIMASIQAVGHISGPHINPGVTLGCVILERIDWKRALVYWAGQYTGSFFGYTLMWYQMPVSSRDLKPCALKISPSLTPLKVFFLEYCASAILFLAVGGATDRINAKWHDAECLRLGFIIFGLIVAIGELSGACLNSARALPSAVLNNVYDHHYVYHLGPILGECTGAVIYKFLYDTRDKLSLNRKS